MPPRMVFELASRNPLFFLQIIGGNSIGSNFLCMESNFFFFFFFFKGEGLNKGH